MRMWLRYWFAPAPVFDLAVVRIVAVGFQLFWVLIFSDQYISIHERAALDDGYWSPLIIMNAFHLPWGWGARPPLEILQIIFALSIGAGALALIGLVTNASLVVFAATSVYLQAYLFSFGDHHHPQAVMMVALSVLALSPCGRALSVDAWLRRRRSGATGGVSSLEESSEFAGWPLKLLQWFFVLMYLSAVWSKLGRTGFDWANGYTLQYYLARDGLRWDSAFAVWMSEQHLLIWLAQIGVLLFQATFFLAVLFPKLRWIYVPAGVALHTFIYLTLTAPFFQWIALYAVFIPWAQAVRVLRGHLFGRPSLQTS